MAIRVSLYSQLLLSWAGAGARPILRTWQPPPPWTARLSSQSHRPSRGCAAPLKRVLVKLSHTERKASLKEAVEETRALSQGVYERQNPKNVGKKPTTGPNSVNSPSWSRFDVARDPNRTPLPRDDMPSANVALPSSSGVPAQAGLAPPRSWRGKEKRLTPFSSGIRATPPRPPKSETGDLSRGTRDNLASVHSDGSRVKRTPERTAKTVKPDALHYSTDDYKDPTTSKYLVAKERFRPSAKKDWSAPQELSPENWLPRNTPNTRLVEDSQKAISAAGASNSMLEPDSPGSDAATDSPVQTRRDGNLERRALDGQPKVVHPPPAEAVTPTPPSPLQQRREKRDAKRRLELIERQRQYLCSQLGVDPDASRHGHEEKITEALERFIRKYDIKKERREGRQKKVGNKKKIGIRVGKKAAKKAAKHREEAAKTQARDRETAKRLAGAILGP